MAPSVTHSSLFARRAARAHDVAAIRIFGPENVANSLNFGLEQYGDLSELMQIPEDSVIDMLKRESYGGGDERRYSRCCFTHHIRLLLCPCTHFHLHHVLHIGAAALADTAGYTKRLTKRVKRSGRHDMALMAQKKNRCIVHATSMMLSA